MKYNVAEAGSMSKSDHKSASILPDKVKNSLPGFAYQLRALGQALEKFRFSDFDLELRSGSYLVKGRASSVESIKFSFSRFVRELLRGSAAHPTLSCAAESRVDLSFAPDEIEQFDMRGRVKRADSNKLPDPYSISQILRGTGSYLDNRDVTTLMGISLNGKWVTVKYETAAGRLEQAKQDLEYFYDYWVKMYLRRSNRVKLPPASDPTLFVTWQGMGRAHSLSNVRG
jgi:hypothetical protein